MWTTRLPCFSCLLLFMLFLLIFTDIKVPHSLTRIHLCVSSLQFHGMWGVWYQIVNLKKILDMLYINLWKWGKKKRKKSHSHLCEFCVSHFRVYDWTFALRLTYMAKKRQSKSIFSPWKADGSLIIFSTPFFLLHISLLESSHLKLGSWLSRGEHTENTIIHPYGKFLLSICHEPDTFLDTEDRPTEE